VAVSHHQCSTPIVNSAQRRRMSFLDPVAATEVQRPSRLRRRLPPSARCPWASFPPTASARIPSPRVWSSRTLSHEIESLTADPAVASLVLTDPIIPNLAVSVRLVPRARGMTRPRDARVHESANIRTRIAKHGPSIAIVKAPTAILTRGVHPRPRNLGPVSVPVNEANSVNRQRLKETLI
jgi:hypothetical protein